MLKTMYSRMTFLPVVGLLASLFLISACDYYQSQAAPTSSDYEASTNLPSKSKPDEGTQKSDSSLTKPIQAQATSESDKGNKKSDSFLDRLIQVQPIPEPDKGNPKLDTFLNQLIQADKQGQADSFARRSNIELKKESVWVIIEPVSNGVEAATLAATQLGAEQLKAGVGPTKNWVKARVPINSLGALANEKSIQFIRLPSNPLEAN